MRKIGFPKPIEYALYYDQYLKLVDAQSQVLKELKKSAKELITLYKSLDKSQLEKPYAPGKWTLKDLLMHMIDTERVFAYRAMRFARLDRSPQPYFDENEFAKNADANKIPIAKLLKEYLANRNATLALFDNFTVKQQTSTGIATQAAMSVRACVWIILGHELHHRKIIEDRYLPNI